MPIGVLFWVLMIVWLIFGLYWNRGDFARGNYGLAGGHLLQFILLAILGWKVFGPLLH
jgi:Na+/proline symporter